MATRSMRCPSWMSSGCVRWIDIIPSITGMEKPASRIAMPVFPYGGGTVQAVMAESMRSVSVIPVRAMNPPSADMSAYPG